MFYRLGKANLHVVHRGKHQLVTEYALSEDIARYTLRPVLLVGRIYELVLRLAPDTADVHRLEVLVESEFLPRVFGVERLFNPVRAEAEVNQVSRDVRRDDFLERAYVLVELSALVVLPCIIQLLSDISGEVLVPVFNHTRGRIDETEIRFQHLLAHPFF